MNHLDTPHLVRVGPHELAHLLDLKHVKLVDVREPHEFARCHIHGAVCDPLSQFDPDRYPKSERARVVLCCGSGKRSEAAASRLLAGGVPFVRHLDGGLECWVAARLSVDTED